MTVAFGLQERFNAEFEAMRHRKRACRERLASMQTRVAELAAQVLVSLSICYCSTAPRASCFPAVRVTQ